MKLTLLQDEMLIGDVSNNNSSTSSNGSNSYSVVGVIVVPVEVIKLIAKTFVKVKSRRSNTDISCHNNDIQNRNNNTDKINYTIR